MPPTEVRQILTAQKKNRPESVQKQYRKKHFIKTIKFIENALITVRKAFDKTKRVPSGI